MKTTPFLLAALAAAFVSILAPGAAGQDMLAQDGASAYVIMLRENASPSEHHAAKELQEHFQACTGAALEIVQEASASSKPMIVLGLSAAARALGVDPDPAALGEQGYVLRTVAPHVVIAGTPEAGTLLGVYDFCQRVLGVRWYAPGVTRLPEHKDLALPQFDELAQPAFLFRDTSYAWPGGDADFRARMRENAGGGGPDHPQGIQHAHDGRCHTYFRFISPGEFFDTHPEYFSEIGGIRRREETQLCLSNPEVLDIVTERMLKRMADAPGVRLHDFSQMDYYNYCQCAKCNETNARYGATGGTQFLFVNQLAERTAKVYPDKRISTLAYMYTEEAPKNMVMHPNVAVWLCHMFPSCDSHPIATCPRNADFKRRAEAWSKICSHLYIWHYIVDFAHYYNPFPNFRAMAADMRFYRDIGAEGIFLQGMGHGGGGGEFSLLRPYYGMQLLWNPDADAEAIIRDFLEGYYGAAWKPIYDYVTLLHDKVTDEDIHMHLYTNPAQGYLPDAIVAQSEALFDQAEAAVRDDDELLERVRVARMPLVYARFFPRNGYEIDGRLLRFNGSIATLGEAQEFLMRMQRHGFATIREAMGDPQQVMLLALAFNTPQEVFTIQNPALSVDIVPFLGGRALRIIHKESGACITAHNTTRNLFFPFCGGEETKLGNFFSGLGAGHTEQYSVVERGGGRLVLEAKSAGVTLRRVFALDENQPVLHITAIADNQGDTPHEVLVRSHLELDLGDLRATRVAFVNRDGDRVSRETAPIIAGLREGEHFLDQHAPKSSWTFTGAKGLDVTQRFDDALLDFAWLYAYPEDLGALDVELWAKPLILPPGEQFTFSHALEIRESSR